MKYLLLFFSVSLLATSVPAQVQKPWNGKRAAVVLTYDDALNVHLDHAIPALDSLKLKGTFYLIGQSGALDKRIPEWRKAAAKGHELGNHTLFHPCASGPGRSWITPENDLRNYTVARMVNEIRLNNTLLNSIDGKSGRTFAYACGDMKIGDTLYIEQMKGEFTGARGVRAEMPPITGVDLLNVPSYMINGQSGEELIALVNEAMANGRLLVFLFHGVGGEHSLNVSLEAHSKLLHFLKKHQKDVWVAPMTEVATYINQYTGKEKNKQAVSK